MGSPGKHRWGTAQVRCLDLSLEGFVLLASDDVEFADSLGRALAAEADAALCLLLGLGLAEPEEEAGGREDEEAPLPRGAPQPALGTARR